MQRPAKPWTPVQFRPQPVKSEIARVAELVDARDLKSLGTKSRAGSIPASGMNFLNFFLHYIYMTFVVTEKCIRCKYTDCVEVCPVDCFYEGPNFLVINPDECIDCALCEPECPVDAIFSQDDLPEKYQEFLALNAELAQKWPMINKIKEAPADADEWAKVDDKLQYLEKKWPEK